MTIDELTRHVAHLAGLLAQNTVITDHKVSDAAFELADQMNREAQA